MKSIRNKTLINLGSIIALFFVLILIFNIIIFRTDQINQAKQKVKLISSDAAHMINTKNEKAVLLVDSMVEYAKAGGFGNRTGSEAYACGIINNNTFISGAYFGYEPDADGKDDESIGLSLGHDQNGRFLPYWYRKQEGIFLEPLTNMETSPYYTVPKATGSLTITEPYNYHDFMLLEVTKPIIINNKFVGIAGIDLSPKYITQELDYLYEYYQTAEFYLVSSKQNIIASNNHPLIGKNIASINALNEIIETIKPGTGSAVLPEENTPGRIYAYAPVENGDWLIILSVAKIEVLAQANPLTKNLILLLSGGFILLIIALYLIANKFVNPLTTITQAISEIATANNQSADKESVLLLEKRNDEIGTIARAAKSINEDIINLIQEIMRREFKYKNLVSNVQGVVFRYVHHDDWTLELLSPGIQNLAGYAPVNFLHNNIHASMSIIHPEDKSLLYQAAANAVTEKKSYSTDCRIICADSKIKWVTIKGQCIYDEQGKPLYLDGIIFDINGQKQLQEELKKKNSILDCLIDCSPDGIIILDLNRNIVRLNHAMKQIYEINGLCAGKKCHQVFWGIDHPCENSCSVAYCLNNEQPITLEIKRNIGLGYKWLEVSSYPMLDQENSKVFGVVSFIRDITGRKNTEEELTHLSLHDALTWLYNRAFFDTELKRLSNSREYPITIITADVDGLKLINDTMGHDAGDEIIKTCAQILKKSLRSSDIIARVGGDEFAVILPNTDGETGEILIKRILANAEWHKMSQPTLPLTISVGMDTADDANTPLTETYKKADDAMYRSKLHKGTSAKSQIINALMAALGERDHITEGHANRLDLWCQRIGEKWHLSSKELNNLSILTKSHDLGKVGIPDHILFKEGPLTEEEWVTMRQHPEIGYRIAISSPDLSGIADLILKHHERWDGKGYPLGIKKDDIPIECLILSIVDAFDAMTHDRPYSKGKTADEAIAELQRCAGSQFHPDLVTVFISVLKEESEN